MSSQGARAIEEALKILTEDHSSNYAFRKTGDFREGGKRSMTGKKYGI
jgi:hypothetical protein